MNESATDPSSANTVEADLQVVLPFAIPREPILALLPLPAEALVSQHQASQPK